MIKNLLEIFSNNSRALEVLYLLDGIKKAVRLDASDLELMKIRNFCNKNKLYLEISDFKVVKIPDIGKGGYANRSNRVPISDPNGLHHIYISKDENKAKFLKFLEHKKDDKAIGEILGYPNCCIEFFMQNKEKQQKMQNDFILPALENSSGFEFLFYTNYAARYFDAVLISHFPHDFNCKETIEIAKKNLNCIKSHSEELAIRLENILKSSILYTEDDGIFVFEDFSFNNSILQYKKIKSTISNNLFELLNKNKKLEVINKNTIKIENKIIENAGFMIFI